MKDGKDKSHFLLSGMSEPQLNSPQGRLDYARQGSKILWRFIYSKAFIDVITSNADPFMYFNFKDKPVEPPLPRIELNRELITGNHSGFYTKVSEI